MDAIKFKEITDELMVVGLKNCVAKNIGKAGEKKMIDRPPLKHDADSYGLLCRDREASCPDCAQVVTNRLVVYQGVRERSTAPIQWGKKCVNCKECWTDAAPMDQTK